MIFGLEFSHSLDKFTYQNEVASEISPGVAGMVSYAGCVLRWQTENDRKVPEEVEAVQDDVMYQGTHPVAGTRSHLLDRFCDVIEPTFLVPLVLSVHCMS
jgi:hypothetical protein